MAASTAARGLVTLELFNLGEAPHPDFDLPIVRRPSALDTLRYVVVDASVHI